jgi:hypothetical protein
MPPYKVPVLDTDNKIKTSDLGSGIADSTTVLFGDKTYRVPGAGSTNIKQTEIDFGVVPISEKEFIIIDSDVSATSQIIAQMAYEATSIKELDETEMDDLQIRCKSEAGQFKMFIRSADGSYLHDTFKINYLIG